MIPSSTSDDSKPNTYSLRIFTGIHQGAELNITSGSYSVGIKDDCDIILSDSGIAADHMRIHFSEDGLCLEEREGAVFIDGRRIGRDGAVLEPNQIITVSDVHMGIGVKGDGWYPVVFPRLTDEGRGMEIVPLRKRKYLSRLIAGMVVCLVVGLGFLLLSGNRSIDVNAVEKIRKIFKQLKVEEPYISLQENGLLRIVGYVKDKEVQQSVVQKLQKMAFSVNYKIYSVSRLLMSCRQVVSNMKLTVTVHYRDHGIVTLKGVVQEKEELESLQVKLKQDVAGVNLIQNQVCVLKDIIPDLNHILIDYGLKDKIEFELHPGCLLATGSVDAYSFRIWENAKIAIMQKYGKNLVIRDKFDKSDLSLDDPGRIALPITGVTIGEHSYITLEGGKKYFEGGSLENGNTIKSITTEKIVILIDGREYYCPL